MKEKVNIACSTFLIPVLIAIFLYIALKYAFWIFFPFVFAFALAFVIRKIVVILIKLTGLKIKEASFVILICCYILLFTSMYFLFSFLIKEGIGLAQNLPYIYQNDIEPIITDFLSRNTIQNSIINLSINDLKNITSTFILNISGKLANLALNVPDVLVTATVTIISSFFLCVDYDKIKNNILELFPVAFRKKLITIKQNIILSLGAMLKCYLIIFVITFIELFAGLSLLRVKYPFIVSFIIALADFLPLIGTGTVLIPWAIISFVSGKPAFSVGVIALYLIITLVRNIIEPKILGKNIGVHPLLTLAAMYIGLKLGGFLLAFLLPFCLFIFRASKKQ